MGLDMYVFRIRKPDLEYRIYTSDEISDLDISVCTVREAERADAAMEQLLPYTSKIQVVNQYYNLEKIIEDYKLPANSYIGMYSAQGIAVSGKATDGRRVSVDISTSEIESKYTISKVEDSYAWRSEEVAYWRKHYSLQELFYELLGDVENCGYYKLNTEIIDALNEEYAEDVTDIPYENPTDKQALFYHEWY